MRTLCILTPTNTCGICTSFGCILYDPVFGSVVFQADSENSNGVIFDSSNSAIERQRHMQPGTHPSSYPVTRFLKDDHRRLEQLLNKAMITGGRIDQGHYDEFRSGLLRHIGMEEKILLPAAQRSNGGAPLSIASTLRLDHGAIAALLMPTPTPELIAVLRSILNKHNEVEEGGDGLYAICDKLAGAQTEDLIAKLRAAPAVAVLPHSDTPAVLGAVRRALERAKYESLSNSMPF